LYLYQNFIQVADETVETIQSNVLQGSNVVLDVEEEGIGERTILSLDAAKKVSSNGTTCFHSSDSKEHCFVDAQPGECEQHVDERSLSFHKKMKKVITKQADDVVNKAEDAAKKAEDAAKNTAKNTVSSVKTIALGPVYKASLEKSKFAMRQANLAGQLSVEALDGLEAGAVLAAKGLEEGAYAVAEGGVLIAEWVEANYCQIGISLALGILFGALLYRPEPASQATTTAATAPLTTTAIVWLSAKETVSAVALGTACDLVAMAFVELIWMSSDVRNAIGAKNKDILPDGIAFSLLKAIDVAAGAMICHSEYQSSVKPILDDYQNHLKSKLYDFVLI
jgi:ElaB/YqjD/DUF883 family membrane-anchored ribosome-binding protein